MLEWLLWLLRGIHCSRSPGDALFSEVKCQCVGLIVVIWVYCCGFAPSLLRITRMPLYFHSLDSSTCHIFGQLASDSWRIHCIRLLDFFVCLNQVSVSISSYNHYRPGDCGYIGVNPIKSALMPHEVHPQTSHSKLGYIKACKHLLFNPLYHEQACKHLLFNPLYHYQACKHLLFNPLYHYQACKHLLFNPSYHKHFFIE